MGLVFLGGALVALGVVLLGDQLGLWNGGDVVSRWWPLGMIGIGILQLTSRPRPWLGAGIVIVLGVLLLFGRIDLLPDDAWRLLLPLVLIVVGGWLLAARARGRRPPTSDEDSLNVFAAFGEATTASSSSAFRGANVTAILGGATLDLRQAVPVADGAEVIATAIFGGAEVFVPAGWDVHVSGLPIFGGVDDQTQRTERPPEGAPRLTVKGVALFGGVEVKDKK